MADKVKDPVCGMELDKDEAAATSEYMGTTYYFCSASCKASFDREPAKYAKSSKRGCCQ